MRYINETGILLIKKWESFQPKTYLCSAGVETIGYGETDKKIINEYRNKEITIGEADILLRKSLNKYCKAVYDLINIYVPLSDNEFAALVSFSYNLGIYSLKVSTLRKVILRYEYDEAPTQFRRWVYAKGKKLRGLVNRRNDEVRLWSL